MLEEKDNKYDRNYLTDSQEKFVDGILQGLSQRQAYYAAYPNSKKWKENTVDSRASVLMTNKKVIKRLHELGWKDKKKVEWTRKKALETINYVMDMNKEDMIRINEAYDEELEQLNKDLQEWIALLTVPNIDIQGVQKHIRMCTEKISNVKKKRRVSSVNTHGIFEGAKILNRMFGYDITKVEVKQEDEERENMKALSIDELKAIAYSNINNEENK